MRLRAEIEKVADSIAKSPVDYGKDTEAILVATEILLDIRDQNERIIELLADIALQGS